MPYRSQNDFLNDLTRRLQTDAGDRRLDDLERSLENTVLSGPNDAGKPRILKVNFLPKENAIAHHCEKYELVTLSKGTAIIRRAGVFKLEIELNTDVNLKKLQRLRIYFNFGPRPLVSKGTQGILEFSGKREFDQGHEEWDHRVVREEGRKVTLEVNVPHDIAVGVWRLILEITPRSSHDRSDRHVKRPDQLLYILFNPWSKHDEVFMSDEEARNEYVLNDVGKIWRGGFPTARGRSWVFGQFDDAVLPASILLLERSGLKPDQRGDPIFVTRAISKMVNYDDDNGLLVGNWSEDYRGGTAPTTWTGSIKIMEEYLRTQRPVKYGQCWVFSGAVTTMCRTLGIPSRSVTNLNSAHDTNRSLTIDRYFDEQGEEFEPEDEDCLVGAGAGDSIWNFHVWNDVWMARPDLPDGYGGWQVIDATPQESSDGFYQCGPASVVAIRNGQTNFNYDVNFVLGEVNADVVRWQKDENEKDGFKKLSSNISHVGRGFLTKKLGKTEPESFDEKDKDDLSAQYKHPEGTKAERVTLHSAVRKTRAARHAFRFPSFAEEDVELELEEIERIHIGQDFTMTIKAKNTSDSTRRVYLVLSATSQYYTGIRAHTIKRVEGLFSIKAHDSQTLRLSVKYSEYYDKLVEYSMIKLRAMANVKETTQTWISEDDFQVIKPNLKIEFSGSGQVGKELPIEISFKNPLDRALRKCLLVVDGPGLLRPKSIPLQDIPPGEVMLHKMNIFPRHGGSRNLVASFNCKELVDITGSSLIDIKAA